MTFYTFEHSLTKYILRFYLFNKGIPHRLYTQQNLEINKQVTINRQGSFEELHTHKTFAVLQYLQTQYSYYILYHVRFYLLHVYKYYRMSLLFSHLKKVLVNLLVLSRFYYNIDIYSHNTSITNFYLVFNHCFIYTRVQNIHILISKGFY